MTVHASRGERADRRLPTTPLRFKRFADYAQLDRLGDSIQSSCDILYNVQDVEEQQQQGRRDSRLNSFFAFPTALTPVSVVVDGYAYVRDEDPLVASREVGSLTLVLLLMAVTSFFANRWGNPDSQTPLLRYPLTGFP